MDMAADAELAPLTGSPKRRQIVAAAEALFLAHGYGAVSMDAIARAARVSKATLYAHFASKDALFAGIMTESSSDNPIDADLFPAEVPDLRAQLLLIGCRVLQFMLRERTLSLYRVTMAESGRFPELGRVFYENGPQRMCERFSAWMAGQVAAGRLAAGDPLLASHQFMALLRSAVFMRATLALRPPPTAEEIDETVRAAVDTFLRAFSPRD